LNPKSSQLAGDEARHIALSFYLREPAVWFITAIASVFILLVLYDAHSLNDEHLETQQALVHSNGTSISAEIRRLLNERRRVVHALTADKNTVLTQLAAEPDNEALIDSLRASFKDYFPDLFAFAVVSQDGVFAPDYMGEYIGDICRTEVREYLASGSGEYKPWIHPQAGNYHYDLMVQREDGGLFFISFNPDELVHILASYQLPNHHTFLLRTDEPGLIDVSAAGPRDKLKREIRFSAEELKAVAVQIPIEGSRWMVAIMPEQAFIDKLLSKNWIRAVKISGAILVFWAVSLGIMFYLQHQREIARRELAQHAMTDLLTGAATRWYFMEQSQRAFADAERYNHPVSIIYFDVDNFKAINDTYGHAAGDHVLKTLATLCRQHTRETDIFGRIGGEEFALTLPNMKIDGALRFAERLRKTIATQPIKIDDTTLTITVSMGVAEHILHELDLESVMSLADTALYRAKSSGRNCVCTASNPGGK
jgi:diguanylate cyclase (GGDEF)-like protein